MKKYFPILIGLLILRIDALYAEEPKILLEGAPLRYAFVNGDVNKFKEENWTQDGYAGGIQEFSLEQKDLPEDLSVSMDGHAIVEDNDYEANVRIEKKDFGYTAFEYQEFSKYYDDRGGVYYPFTTLFANRLGRELRLDIGHLRVEAGLTLENFPHITFAYERHFKDGAKSRLTWTPVTEGSLNRNIGPSFQDIHEIVDSVEINVSHTLKGFEIKNKEEWEWAESQLMREERSLSTTAVAADKKIRDQYQGPESRLFSSTTAVERWFRQDRVFTGGAYHFLHIGNSEVEEIFEMNQNRTITNFTNPKQIRGARADNEYDDHTWVGNFLFVPLKSLSVNTNVRSEIMDRSGNSSYPSDTTAGAPDGIINTTEISQSEDKVARFGEGISLRFTGIPRTALYNEFEFEQVRNWLGEDRNSLAGQSASNANEIFSRETIVYVSRGIWTIGGQWVPCHFAKLTTHFRINRSNNDYDDTRETQPGATVAKSAFFDVLNIQTHEFATHLTLKPKPWLRPSVRYRYQIRNYFSRAEDLEEVQTEMDSHIFTFDVSLQPLHNLLVVTGFSPQYAWVLTPARNLGKGGAPRFQANVLTWLLDANYNINEHLSLVGGLEYTAANNFNDNAEGGLPLGAAYHEFDFSSGVTWNVNEMFGIEMKYAFTHYAGNDLVDANQYDANVIWLKTKFSWA